MNSYTWTAAPWRTLLILTSWVNHYVCACTIDGACLEFDQMVPQAMLKVTTSLRTLSRWECRCCVALRCYTVRTEPLELGLLHNQRCFRGLLEQSFTQNFITWLQHHLVPSQSENDTTVAWTQCVRLPNFAYYLHYTIQNKIFIFFWENWFY